MAATKFKAEISGLMPEQRAQVTNNTQVNITSDNDAARRIGYIMAKGLQLLQSTEASHKLMPYSCSHQSLSIRTRH